MFLYNTIFFLNMYNMGMINENKYENIRLFAMESAKNLGEKIAKDMGIELTGINRTQFADGESILVSESTVRNMDAFIVASASTPVNDNIMELLLFIDSLKRASAKSINVVLSYYGYARQDRKAAGRQPIGAKLIADLLETAGATKVIAVDLHNPSIQGFFNIPLDDLRGQYIMAPILKEQGKFTVVSPDHGGAVRARLMADLISNSVQIAIVDKRRTGPNQSESMGILGTIDNNNAVIIDDMIDTGGTIIKAAKALKENGAKRVVVAATHGLFTRGFQQFEDADFIDQVIITDSIDSVYNIKSDKLRIVSLAPLLAKTIEATVESTSIASIYQDIRDSLDK